VNEDLNRVPDDESEGLSGDTDEVEEFVGGDSGFVVVNDPETSKKYYQEKESEVHIN